ncbi:MAG: hypothetical protein JSW40_10200 [Candidatus Omnitrophota bacterium]|nr:MAG: hypothetical protein JSW40_10200 [Candidatus Omnitrophota bacterium]
MAQDQSPTPERELLKIIEDKNASGSVQSKKTVRKAFSFFSLGGLRGRFLHLKGNFGALFSRGFSLDIKHINALLFGIVAILIFVLIFTFVSTFLGLNDEVEAAFKIDKKISEFRFHEDSPLKKASHYLEMTRKRDIFELVSKAPKGTTVEIKKEEVVKEIVKRTESLRLVGISWSDDPDAMIEDTRSRRTFFVKRGELVNGVRVEAILKDKVLLSYEGEEVELK